MMITERMSGDGINAILDWIMEESEKRFGKELSDAYGTAVYPKDGETLKKLVKAADFRMRFMKNNRETREDCSLYLELLKKERDGLIRFWRKEMKATEHASFSERVTDPELQLFFNQLTDIDIPICDQPFYKAIPRFCGKMMKQGIQVQSFLISASLWRQIFMQHIESVYAKGVPFDAFRIILKRLDEIEYKISVAYSELNNRREEDRVQQYHEERLALIGKMAASMAHEIRNPLTSVKGFVQLLRNDLNRTVKSGEQAEKYIRIIESELETIQTQISSLLSFSKRQVKEETFEQLSVSSLLHTAIQFVGPRMTKENVILHTSIDQDFHIYGQKVALQQVIFNILNNGLDAVSHQDEKCINIKTFSDEHANFIEISNNGPEIPEDIKENIFEPFMTTKKDGTGLGLAICKQIMEKNNGDIMCISNACETVFRLRFDRSREKQNQVINQEKALRNE